MYVKELVVRGFKSFANATVMRFEPGITAVVGPNGSGKSNIVDALSWVMGEQGAKSLRGTSMEDVIFAGTSGKPPAGRAHVSLTIDNSDGELNIDYSEVKISRTIYRNGGSEYAINGSPVRLLDVQELLSDTGLGSHMHVIVGQGRLDSILKAEPADNRAFIEEAAGILKHKKRKERALRKLKGTQSNLDRLDDLLREVQRQLGPLRRQARISRRADNIQITLRDAQSRLFADDGVRLAEKRNDLREKIKKTEIELFSVQNKLAQVKGDIEKLEKLSLETSPQTAMLNETVRNMSNMCERFKALSSVAGERSAAAMSGIASVSGDDPQMLLNRAKELEEQILQQRSSAAKLREECEKAAQNRENAEKEVVRAREKLADLTRNAKQREEKIMRLREGIVREESASLSAQNRAKDLKNQTQTFAAQLEEAKKRLEAAGDFCENDIGEEIEKADALKEKAAAAAQNRDLLAEEKRKAQSESMRLAAKAEAINDTRSSRVSRSESSLEERFEVKTKIPDCIRTVPGWEEAVSLALGQAADAYAVSDRETAAQMLNYALENSSSAVSAVIACSEEIGNGIDDADSVDGENGGKIRSSGKIGESLRESSIESSIESDETNPESHAAKRLESQSELREGLQPESQSGLQSESQKYSREFDGAVPVSCVIKINENFTDRQFALAVKKSVDKMLEKTGIAWDSRRAFAEYESRDAFQTVRNAALPQTAKFDRIVTRQAQIVTEVSVSGGKSAQNDDLSLIAKRDEALKKREEIEKRINEISRKLEKAEAEYKDLSKLADEAKSVLTEKKIRAEQAKREAQAAKNSVDSLEKRLKETEEKIEKSQTESKEHAQNAADLREQAESAAQMQSGSENFNEVSALLRECENRSDKAKEAEIAAKMASKEAESRLESLRRQITLLKDNARRAEEHRKKVREENEKRRADSENALRISRLAQQAQNLLASRMNIVEHKQAELQKQASQHDGQLSVLREERNRLEPVVSSMSESRNKLNIERERLTVNYEQLIQRVNETLGIDFDYLILNFNPEKPIPITDENGALQLLEEYKDRADKISGGSGSGSDAGSNAVSDGKSGKSGDSDNSGNNFGSESDKESGSESDKVSDSRADGNEKFELEPQQELSDLFEKHPEYFKTCAYNREEQKKRLEQAKKELEKLGKVNPLATEEYDALQARSKYLNEQRDDVVNSRNDLLKLIKDLEVTMVDVFKSAFEDTRQAFEKVFATLFPGGKGRLRLENPEDILSSGVVVEATPAGKRVKQMSLLSGGERSLTALAMLFAIFTARPSPFYVMDEVEAALDDVNLTRLLNAVEDLRARSQLIIITHQQRTMSIADALYGVTMRGDGVTAVVSQKLDREKKDVS